MNKILLIIQREYLSRVRKKSFIVMTILGPILMASLMIAPILISKYSQDEGYIVKVVDQSPTIFTTLLPSSSTVAFVNDTGNLEQVKKAFDADKFYGILYIPADIMKNPGGAVLFTQKQANIKVTSYIEKVLKEDIESAKLKFEGITPETLKSIKTNIDLKTMTLKGEENDSALNTIVGFIAGIMIYMFIFLYGVQVMRGVIEEKTNRIVEVIISSVKPFQLMMGKIIGIALVGFTQFLLWIILTFTISSVVTGWIGNNKTDPQKIAMQIKAAEDKDAISVNGTETTQQQSSDIDKLMNNLSSVNFPLIITCFIVYFLGGYLLYSALFAAIGAAVDNETETQQFMLPVTIPLILSFIVAQSVVTNPDSQIGFWFSMIPFTSPVVMMVRIPFGVPYWEIVLSISLLIIGFMCTTWIAGRIYRTGILLYGKKINYRELSRWLFYKD
jgi:ABC-2 type transport system permease protein